MTNPTGPVEPGDQDPQGPQDPQGQSYPQGMPGQPGQQSQPYYQSAPGQPGQSYSQWPQDQQYYQGQPGYPGQQYLQYGQPQTKEKNTVGLIGLIIAVIGFIFACVPGALILGWILLPIGFIVSLVSLFLKGKKPGLGIAGLIVSVVGTVVGFSVFFLVVDHVVDDALDEIGSGGDVSVAVPEGAETDGDGDAGTRENPYPLGSTVTDKDWSVTINSVDLDAAAAINGENSYNDPAPEGMTYILVNVTINYIGDSDGGEMPWTTVDYVTPDGNTISSTDNFVMAPDSLDTISELYKGGSTSGNIALAVPQETVGDGVLAVSPGMLSGKTFVSVR